MIVSEETFTWPTDWCRSPGRWSAHDDQSAEVEVSELVAAFVRALKPDYVIETGTAHGYTAQAIGEALNANRVGRLDTLEIDETLVAEASERCAGLPVTVHECSSLEFTPAEPVDFVWFDSLLDLRIPELDRYLPHMRAEAIVGFHDVSPRFGDFADRLKRHPRLRPMFLHTPRGVCFSQIGG